MMTLLTYPPFWLLLGALLCLLLRAPPARLAIALAAPLLALLALYLPEHGQGLSVTMLGYRFDFFDAGQGRRLLVTAMVLAAAGLGHRALRSGRDSTAVAGLAATAFAVAAALAGDLRALYVVFDALLLASLVLVWMGPGGGCERAGVRFAILHLLASAAFKLGIEMTYADGGAVLLAPMALQGVGPWLIFLVLLLKAALLPLSAWLADTYSRGSSTSFGFLAVTTLPVALLMLLILFPGEPLLAWIGGASLGWALLQGWRSQGVGPRLAHLLGALCGLLALLIGLIGATQGLVLAAAIGALFLLFVLFAGPFIDIVRANPEAAGQRLPWLAGEERPASDLDVIWRRAGFALGKSLVDSAALMGSGFERWLTAQVERLWRGLMRHHGSEGILAGTWPTGSMVTWVGVMLLVLLVIGARMSAS
jgi:formate hydrogenlyase subunit 3/multisubunit Na+/H+ antiporter MnhD subunit